MPLHASTRKPGRPKSPDIERRIIRAAQKGFTSRGFTGIAMDQLAWNAGTSKTTVYLYFQTKQDLFNAALDDLIAQLPPASELTSGVNGISVEERLLVVAERAGRLFSSPSFELIGRALASDVPSQLRERIRKAAGEAYFQAVNDFLRDEAAHGTLCLKDFRSATSIFMALIMGPEALHSRWSGTAVRSIDDAHLRYAVKLFVKGHAGPMISTE